MEKISVVIPYYNNSNTIERALRSVERQTFPAWEVILVDDGSETLEEVKLKSYLSNGNFKIIRHEFNRGEGCARNTGILSATGDWIAHLDADDEWESDHLESYISLQLDEFALYFCRSRVNAPDYSVVTKKDPVCSRRLSEYIFVHNGFIPSPSFFLSTDLARKFLFNDDRRHTDYDFLFRLEAAGVRFVMSDHVGVVVHWENNTLDAREKKGGTAEYSLNWARKNRKYFTDKSYAYFLFMNVLVPLLRNGQRRSALELMRTENLWPALGSGNLYRTASLFLFREIVKPGWKKK